MMFAIPRGRITYIGTTDTNYHGDLNRIVATQDDVKYILNSLIDAFPTIKLSIEGKMAERVVDKVVNRLVRKGKSGIKSVQTKNIPLTGKKWSAKEVKELIKSLGIKIKSHQLDDYFSWYLVTNYGHAATEILENITNYENSPEISLTRAELAYGLEKELVFSLEDFYVRRTGKLYFEIQNIALTKEYIIEDFAKYFKWSDAEKVMKVAAFDEEYQDATTFYDKEFSST